MNDTSRKTTMPKSQHISVAMLDAGLASAVMIRRKPIEDYIHRVLTGQTVTPNEQRIAGLIVLIWFLMDAIERSDWLLRWR